MRVSNKVLLVFFAGVMLFGCDDDNKDNDDKSTNVEEETTTDNKTFSLSTTVPDTYEFSTRFDSGKVGDVEYDFDQQKSTVSYSGQIFRHLLISDLKDYIGTLTTGSATDPSVINAELNRYYSEKSVGDDDTQGRTEITHGYDAEQTRYEQISANKNLKAKIYGEGGDYYNAINAHPDNSKAVLGWGDNTQSADAIIQVWFETIANNAGPSATKSGSDKAYVTNQGLDLQQLTQKFLLGAVTYSQAADKYLDGDLAEGANDTPKVKNGVASAYTNMEHSWDEGFGYFGAARNYGLITDTDIKENANTDIDGSGTLDLTAEYSFGHSQNAAKRDLGSSEIAKTDYSQGAMNAFLTGRSLISTGADLADIKAQRDIALANWEKAIASTVVHYLNELINDDYGLTEAELDEANLAKHWAEMKGFALALQFNPFKKITDEQLINFHAKVGNAPVIDGDDFNGTAEKGTYLQAGISADRDEYITALSEARDILGSAYAFDAVNITGW